jgi:hypothetical protein
VQEHSPRLASDSEDSAGSPPPSIAPAYGQVDTYRHPHPGLPPLRSYVVTCLDDITARHEGRGLVLDTVLEFETRGAADRPPGEGFFDEAVWEGDRVVAVLRRSGNAVETIRLDAAG